MDFVALDFETATANANSACQLALVVVCGGEIASEHEWLIRPPRLQFSTRNIAIHGIRPEQVRNAPSMAGIWPELGPLLADQVLIAHNARFDINVLLNSLAAYDIACPWLEFNCTRALAYAAWPGHGGYGLKKLGQWLGIDFKHHDALEDSRCCAQIALTIAQEQKCQSLEALEKQLQVSRGTCRDGTIRSPKGRRRSATWASGGNGTTDRWGFPSQPRSQPPLGSVNPNSILAASGDELPLSGKSIVLLGPLRGLNEEQSRQLIEKLGGECQTQISAATSYVVASGTTIDGAREAVAQASTACDTQELNPRVLSERQFRALLPGGKAAAW